MIIEEILDARDECVMMKITGEKVRFNRLRSLCKKYNEYEDEKVFDLLMILHFGGKLIST